MDLEKFLVKNFFFDFFGEITFGGSSQALQGGALIEKKIVVTVNPRKCAPILPKIFEIVIFPSILHSKRVLS